MLAICGWCGEFLGQSGRDTGEITHGICGECAASMLALLDDETNKREETTMSETTRTLRITAADAVDRASAWELLGDNALAYGDNGDDPSGDYWLPMTPLDEEDEGVSDVLAAELGEMVDAVYTTAEGWLRAGYEANPTADMADFDEWLAEALETDEAYRQACAEISNQAEGYAGFGEDVIVYVPFPNSASESTAESTAEARRQRDDAPPADSPRKAGRDRMFL